MNECAWRPFKETLRALSFNVKKRSTKESKVKLNILMAGLCLAAVPVASPAATQSTQSVKYVTIDGEVLRYEPGRVIVIRGADNREVLYNLNSGLVVPADVRVGQRVTLYTEPALDGGTQVVKRVTTTSVSPDGNVRRTTEDVRTLPSGETTRTVVGDVIRYEPGRVIVVRGSDNREVSYNLNADVAVPADVRVGRGVTLYTEAGRDGGTQLVSRVTTTSITPEGDVQRTTEDTRTTPQGSTTTTSTTTVSGRVDAYVPGKTLTITRADGTQATYIITSTSTIPPDLAPGKTIAIVPFTTVNANGELVIRTISYAKPR